MEDYLRSYLEYVGITHEITAHEQACEICGEQESTPLVDEVEIGPDRFGKLPVVACTACGHLFQNPQFNRQFYEEYYDKYYRQLLFGDTQPEKDFVLDQVRRGELLYRSLESHLPRQGRLLDVGCSAGGLMVAFAKRGWEVLGTDPDGAYVRYGRERLGLDVRPMPAEDMALPDRHFDLVIITGSLEHVFDVNKVLSLCRQASREEGLLLVEGRALGYGAIKGYFSHNHRRYLNGTSTELLMLKHGWSPVMTTAAPLCGPTRPGGVFVLGRAGQPLDGPALRQQVRDGRRRTPESLRQELSHLRGLA